MNGIGMAVYWDAAGRIVGTIDFKVEVDEDGKVLGVVDLYECEQSGVGMPDGPSNSVAGGWWPEWIGGAALMYKVQLEPGSPNRIAALVHDGWPASQNPDGTPRAAVPASGALRVKAQVMDRVTQRIAEAQAAVPPGEPWEADVRDILGTPTKPMQLRDDGSSFVPKPRTVVPRPVIRARSRP